MNVLPADPTVIIGAVAIMVMAIAGGLLLTRAQSRSYRSYLEQHTAETQKITTNQQALLAQQEVMIAHQADLVAAVTRVAKALEQRRD